MTLSVNKVGFTPNYSLAFNGKDENAKTFATEKKSSKETAKNVALLGLTAVGIAAAAMLAIKTGKAKKLQAQINELTQGLKNQKYFDVNDFKKIGKFEKGVATIDGKGFSGKLFQTTGSKSVTMTYKDGKLVTSKIVDPLRSQVITKAYEGATRNGAKNIVTINTEGAHAALTEVFKKADGTRIIERTPAKQDYTTGSKEHFQETFRKFKTIISPDGKVQKLKVSAGTVQNPNFKNGRELHLLVERDLDTGHVVSSNYRIKPSPQLPTDKHHVYPKYADTTQTSKRVKAKVNGYNATEIYRTRRDGKLVREAAYAGSYNPKSGVLTKVGFGCDFSTGEYTGNRWITMTDKKNPKTKLSYALDSKGRVSDVHLHAAGKGELVGSEYCNQGGTIEQALEKIKELNLPFREHTMIAHGAKIA